MNPKNREIKLRSDLAAIEAWVPEKAHVLDLGCGSGELLCHLKTTKNVSGYGIDIDADSIADCIGLGINVIEADLDDGLSKFSDQQFDAVIMSYALQALQRPDIALEEMLRIGKVCIVTFPNFGYWRARSQSVRGRMPVTKTLKSAWFDTGNIHLCTVRDFEDLCGQRGWTILNRHFMHSSKPADLMTKISPNLFADTALYLLTKP